MKLLSDLFRASLLLALLAAPAFAEAPDLTASQPVRDAFAEKVKELGKKKAAAVAGTDGWFFLTAELRFLSVGPFWGEAAAKVSHAPKPDLADPLAAIVDFQKQLKAKGVDLLLVPVPPKAAIYPDKIIGDAAGKEKGALATLKSFYSELTNAGVEVLDLAPTFEALRNSAEPDENPYCQTDTHWSPIGCQAAAKSIAVRVAKKLGPQPVALPYLIADHEYELEGDLAGLLPAGAPHPEKEKLKLRQISVRTPVKAVPGAARVVPEGKPVGPSEAIKPDPDSPVLVIGDSHTLVFHDFAGERAGLLDQLALELHAAPDLIGTRGSGSTAVRISLYRKSVKEPDYLSKKKIIVWCFTAREFTESEQGWAKLPVSK